MAGRFRVSSVLEKGEDEGGGTTGGTVTLVVTEEKRDDGGERIPLCDQHSPLALYEDDYEKQGKKIGQMLRSLSGYASTEPNSQEVDEKKPALMGTLMGVYLPCLQNIFGVLFFIRLSWIVGTAGIVQSFFVVFLCASVTFLTSISLSAIATNGVVSGGGPYYMISRNLGPELGGAVGILFYLGTTIAASMYLTGAVEILTIYIYPASKIFDSDFNNFRLYGTMLLLIVGCIVLGGVKIVNKFALPVVFVVVFCILSTFLGVFVRINGTDGLKFCMVGDRPVDLIGYMEKNVNMTVVPECTAEGLEPLFCLSNGKCEDYFGKMRGVRVWKGGDTPAIREERAIKGLLSGAFWDNLWPKYRTQGTVLSKNPLENEKQSEPHWYYVFADINTSYMVLVGVFFPSVTGIMAGSNRSGNLRDAARSIPMGTLFATCSTSVVYLSATILIGGSVSEMLLRDKLGSSALGKLTVAELSWPFPTVILFGCFLSTIGAGLQSLTGAPRLLQAIAADDVIPFLSIFRVMDSRGEPIRAILVTLVICCMGILIAVIEQIAALITQFFLMCYLGVNTACALQSLLKAPGWRPGFTYFHPILSLIGAILCVAVMFISAWHFALFAIITGIAVYKYIEFAGAQKEWGDGIRGLGLSAARFALLNLEEKSDHSRNWRPQLLVIIDDIESETMTGVLSFISQLKAGKGLTMVAHVIEGNFIQDHQHAQTLQQKLYGELKKNKIKGFCDVLVAENVLEGTSSLIQTSGLGGLRHNSVILTWPERWGEEHSWSVAHRFVASIRAASAARCSILVPKGAPSFPKTSERIAGTIDVWWVVHDGGLLMLLPFLLRQHKTWKNTQLRLFAIAQLEDNNVEMKNELQKFLYQLRIDAQVNVIEIPNSDISDYTYERTMKMEERSRILKEMSRHEAKKDIQVALEDANRERKLSRINEDDTMTTMETRLEVVEEEKKENEEQKTPKGVRFTEEDKPTANGPAKAARRRNYNVHKMHTAVKLNELMRGNSSGAQLVVVNLPGPPDADSDTFYMEFIDALTESLSRVLLVRGTGAEVVTIYS